MIVTGVQCDVCTKQALNGNPFGTPDLPPEWFTLFQGKISSGSEGYHFCSVRCLNQWSEKLLIASIPVEVPA